MANARQFMAARTGAWAKSGGGWTNPYITDGLVAMWDGEWNAGGGKHDANSTVWKDLSGNGYDLTLGKGTFTENGMMWNTVGSDNAAFGDFDVPVTNTNMTIEAVHHFDKYATLGGSYRKLISLNREHPWASVFIYGTKNYITRGKSYYGINPDGNLDIAFSIVLPDDVDANQWTSFKKGYLNGAPATAVGTGNYGEPDASHVVVGDLNSSNIPAASYITRCIRVYDHQLTDSEIAANYAIDKVRFNLP